MAQTREERVVVWQRFVLDPDTPEDVYVESIQQALTRAELSGAELLACLSGTLLLSFDGIELEDAIELARTEVAELRGKPDALRVHIAIALGELEMDWDSARGRSLRGVALDRAQALANRARSGEIVLDEPAAQRAEELYLFAREVVVGAWRGQALDPNHPHKRLCRDALSRLSPAPLAASAAATLAALQTIARAPLQQRVAIYTDVPSAGHELADHLARAIAPACYLRFGRKAGGYQPLGSL
jgi:hypothetical protein